MINKSLIIASLFAASFGLQANDKDFNYNEIKDITYEVKIFNSNTYDPIDFNNKPTISFKEHKNGNFIAYGNASCNSYRGTVVLNDQGQFKLDKVMSTKMMCMGGINEMESIFLGTFRDWTNISIKDNELSLEGVNNSFKLIEKTK